MREYITAVEQAAEPTDVVEFRLDGKVLRAHQPTEGQLAMLMAAFGRHTSDRNRVAGAIDFFVTVLDDDSHNYVVDRLLSREGSLSLDTITNIMRDLVEEWTARPTQQRSGSTPSPSSAGQNSMPTTSPSTSSGSDLIASSTASTPGVY